MITGNVEGKTEKSQRANIQSRKDNSKTKDSSGWQDAPGAAMLLLCWKGLLSCGAGQLQTGGLTGGRVRASQPIHEALSAQRKGEQTLIQQQ